ncbi:MAG: hypothetical protein B7Z07_00405 [Sphingomonadales bacterium 32-67-7]|nr:MAG: hypothetical protein B7Z07_00405 [Sphingomonadales bacterium 32-67-7]
MTTPLSPVELYHLACRSAERGRVARDPVVMLAAAKIAGQLGEVNLRASAVREDIAGPTAGPAGALGDARPVVAALRSEARFHAAGTPDEALVADVDAMLNDLAAVPGQLDGMRLVVRAGRAVELAVPHGRSVVIAGDGRSPLLCNRNAMADATASPNLALLVAAAQPGTADRVRIDNVGRFSADLLCVWAR